jgi:hypothetical protein
MLLLLFAGIVGAVELGDRSIQMSQNSRSK